VIEDHRNGWFCDIEFFPGIIFAESRKKDVQDLFIWDDTLWHIEYLNTRLRTTRTVGDNKDITYY